MDAIVTEGLTKHFGARVAVERLDLTVRAGGVFGFLGPNGAGKTTTIAMLLGLIQPTAGRALVFGHDVRREPQLALANVGAMIEGPAFYPYLSGRDNLWALALAGGLPSAAVDSALATVELTSHARAKFRGYSQGMRQRLGIAAALLHEPQLIILDEPTNGLDPAGQHEMRDLIRLLAQSGRTIFLSSHLLHEIEQICDEVAILKEGRMIAGGPVAQLLSRGRGVLVRVAGDQERAARLLGGLEWVGSVAQHDGALLVDAPAERAAELNAVLAAQAIMVAEIRPNERRLEDFFLEITRAETSGERPMINGGQ